MVDHVGTSNSSYQVKSTHMLKLYNCITVCPSRVLKKEQLAAELGSPLEL